MNNELEEQLNLAHEAVERLKNQIVSARVRDGKLGQITVHFHHRSQAQERAREDVKMPRVSAHARATVRFEFSASAESSEKGSDYEVPL